MQYFIDQSRILSFIFAGKSIFHEKLPQYMGLHSILIVFIFKNRSTRQLFLIEECIWSIVGANLSLLWAYLDQLSNNETTLTVLIKPTCLRTPFGSFNTLLLDFQIILLSPWPTSLVISQIVISIIT